ncbi:hypothetical protein [Actinophytocola sp.]|uniref:hypothetical protein n=1 Tax=Actinophytocola sp. TaxID=1872138 RepID=UPI002ED5E00C
MRRNVRAVLAALSLSLILTGGLLSPARSETAPHRPSNGFARSGPWNTKLPRHVPLAENSAAIVANIKQDKDENFQVWAFNTHTWSSPVYTVGRHTPRLRWTFSDCLDLPHLAPVIADTLSSVPTPPGMLVSQGTDNTVAIYQPSTDTYWDFWRAEQDSEGNWSACWGGKIEHYSRNPGIFDNPLGAAATGLPFGAFLIRIEELRRGRIDHALNIQTVRVRANCNSWPANRNDGNTEGADFPCEGQRFRLDPAFDVNTLRSPAARTIARAMQEYGLIMSDKSGSLATQAEDPRPYGGVNPYHLLTDPTNEIPDDDSYTWLTLADIPVERLQALPLDYGRPQS